VVFSLSLSLSVSLTSAKFNGYRMSIANVTDHELT
jgi:hypothetical protein